MDGGSHRLEMSLTAPNLEPSITRRQQIPEEVSGVRDRYLQLVVGVKDGSNQDPQQSALSGIRASHWREGGTAWPQGTAGQGAPRGSAHQAPDT